MPVETGETTVTDLLEAWSDGSREALSELVPIVYDELKRRAERELRGERPGSTLTPTALVHEAYLRLAKQNRTVWHNRSQFWAVAATLMRRVLIDHHRRRKADKRPPSRLRVTFSPDLAAAPDEDLDIAAVNQALERLATFDPELARIVEMRWFGGCGLSELAEALGKSEATVKRRWRVARAWLRRELSGA